MAGRRGNNEGSWWYDKEAKRWKGDVTIRGRRIRRTAKTEREVKEKLRTVQRNAEQGAVSDRRLTLGAYLAAWLDDTAAQRVRASSLQDYRSRLGHVARMLGHIRLADLQPADIRRCYARLEKSGLGKRTVHAIHGTLKTALKDAIRDRKIGWNPMDAVDAPRFSPQEPLTLSLEEAARLIAGTSKQRLGLLWRLILETGLRIGEATALRWRDVDLEAGVLRVEQTVHRVPGGGRELGETKTKASRRIRYLDEDLCAALRAHRQEQRKEQMRAPIWEDLGLVFCGEYGQILDARTSGRALDRATERLGLPRVTNHGLRHTFVTLSLYEMHEPAGVVQRAAGHTNVSTTVNLYGHPDVKSQREAATRLGAALRRAREGA
jgi:integrase